MAGSITKGQMRSFIKTVKTQKQRAQYLCYTEEALSRALKMAVQVCKESNIAYTHPSTEPLGIPGEAGNVFEFIGGGSITLVAMSQTKDKPLGELRNGRT